MKKTIRWILATIIFLTCNMILFAGVSQIFRQKGGHPADMVHSFYSLDDNSVDVLCLGSSHGYTSFQPNILWKEFGITSYVLCSPQQPLAMSYYLLKEALEYQHPKVVLLESYYIRVDNKDMEVPLRFALDGMHLDKVKLEVLASIRKDMPWKEKLSYYIPFLKYHVRWNSLENRDFNPRLYLKGSALSYSVFPQEEPELSDMPWRMSKSIRKYLKKIRKLCDENDIQLIIYAAPYGIEDDYEHYVARQAINNTLEKYCARNDIPFFFYQRTGEAGIDFATDFADHSHMNAYGAEKVTMHLGNYIAEQYKLPDHRGDAAYRSWDEDYEKYQKDVEEALAAAQGNG